MVTLGTLLKDASLLIEKSDALVLLCDLLDKDKGWLLTHRSEQTTDDMYAEYRERVRRRASGEPVAYITGKKEFYSIEFEVTRDVLIPRPDTEILAEWAIEHSRKEALVLDICTGSGCLGLTVANYHKCRVTLLDISDAALKVAERNAKKLGLDVRLIRCDILTDPIKGEFDLIIANPPYVETPLIANLMPDVRYYEPVLALDGGRDGLDFYPSIIKKGYKLLDYQGYLGVEVGIGQAEIVSQMMDNNNFKKIEIIKDYSGIPRVVTGYKP